MDEHRARTAQDRARDFYKRMVALRNRFDRDHRDHWQLLNEFLAIRRGRYLSGTDELDGPGRSKERYNRKLTVEAALALRTLEGGMMAGVTSETRPWMKLAVGSDMLDEDPDVREWLDDVRDILLLICSSSNFYQCARNVWNDLGGYGTACIVVYEDYHNVIWCYVPSPGEALLAMNHRRVVDTMYRRDVMTVSQLVMEFGLDNVSEQTREMWRRKAYDELCPVLQVIEPRQLHSDHSKPANANMPWRNCYVEFPTKAQDEKRATSLLQESGFEERPFMAPRWSSNQAQAYGDSPGMLALGETQSLHQMKLRRGQAIDYAAQPVLALPSSMSGQFSRLPGANNYYDGASQTGRVGGPLWEPSLALRELREELAGTVQMIRECFFADLFQMLTLSDRRQMTATEVAERHEEKLLMLGPVLDNVNTEFLDPFVDRVFAIASRAGILPPPPDSLPDGMEVRVEYTSLLAQAQKLVGLGPIERVLGLTSAVAGMLPAVRHKIDGMKTITQAHRILGAPAEILRSDDEANELARMEAEAAAQAQMAEQMPDVASSAKTLSETQPTREDLLGAYLGR